MLHTVTGSCIHIPNLGFLPQKNYRRNAPKHDFSRTEARSQSHRHSDLKIVHNTPQPLEDAATHLQIWEYSLK